MDRIKSDYYLVYIFKKEKNKNIVILCCDPFITYLHIIYKRYLKKAIEMELNSHRRSIVIVDESKIRIYIVKKKFYNRMSYILA